MNPLAPTVALIGLCLSLTLATQARADEASWTVQIGALEEPNEAFAAAARDIGRVWTMQTRGGLTRYRVGEFDDVASADRTLEALRSAGYEDAYVVQTSGLVAARAALPAVSSGPPVSSSRDEADLESLPEAIRSRVVYLDGELHVKDGDRFTPLAEYREK